MVYLHSKNESLGSKPEENAAKEDWLDKFLERDQSVERNDGIGRSKFIPLSTDVRFTKRCVNKLVIVGKFEDIDEIGELFLCKKSNKVLNFIHYLCEKRGAVY